MEAFVWFSVVGLWKSSHEGSQFEAYGVLLLEDPSQEV